MTSVSRKLAYFLLISGFIAVFPSPYPIIFWKSYVSPGYGPELLYNDFPLISGYKSSDREIPGVILGRWSERIIINDGRHGGV
jgi:hypothetical protein